LLSQGAVYYPGSGAIEGGNVFVFGHSTNWSVVRNQAYKTFNNLDDLKAGDLIYLTAGGEEYAYEVERVRVAPDSEVLVSFGGDERRLTLSTCNTFGLKEERIVVEAHGVDDLTI
jgi:LPXTG-site transpeptidase (sortase) family protein